MGARPVRDARGAVDEPAAGGVLSRCGDRRIAACAPAHRALRQLGDLPHRQRPAGIPARERPALFPGAGLLRLCAGAIAQAAYLSRRAATEAPRRFAGNLVGPAIYTAIESAIEGTAFFAAPHHLAYWAFAAAIGALQHYRWAAGESRAPLLLIAESVVRSSILFAMYAIFETLSAPGHFKGWGVFFEDPSHVFIAWAVTLLGLVGGLGAVTAQRYLVALRALSRQLRVYSQWLFGRALLEQAVSDPARLALARRDRAILFMDVRGFTAWAEAQPPEVVVEALNAYYTDAESVFARHPPVRFKFNADEVMAVFARPADALEGARDLAEAARLRLRPLGLGAGAGLHWGPVVEGLMGAADVKSYDVIGDTVNTAKRIEGAARGGEILLSEDFRRAADVACVHSREVAAKGKSTPLLVSLAPPRP
jgi:adenylate cyclase